MTLLESVVAFVILALAGIACLDLSRGSAQLERSSVEWSHAVSVAEAALTSGAAGTAVDEYGDVALRRLPWAKGVDRLDVTVAMSSGRTLRMSRLVPVPRSRGGARDRGALP